MRIVKLKDVWTFRIMEHNKKYVVCGGISSYDHKHKLEEFDTYEDAVNYMVDMAKQPDKDAEIVIRG